MRLKFWLAFLLLMGTAFGQNPALNIPNNAAKDLGSYSSNQLPDCTPSSITDYSGFSYDSAHNQMLMFGGGHAATPRTDVDAFSFSSLAWGSLYNSTPVSAMSAANVTANGSWSTTGHPLARHTYDMQIFAPNTGEYILLGQTNGAPNCGSAPPYAGTKISHFNPTSLTWTYSSAATIESMSTSAFDPISGKIIILQQYGMWVYDPVTKVLTQVNQDVRALSYAQNMVYFPPNGRMYYIRNNGEVWEVTLNRSNFSQSTIVKLSGITGTLPNVGETGWDYDSVNQLIGGGITNGVFYAFNPVSKQWSSSTIQLAPGSSGSVGTIAFHAISYTPTDNGFLFINQSKRTWFYRYSGVPAPPDTTQPTVAFTNPTEGATVNGTIAVSADASDNVGVVGVQFKLDGNNLGPEDTSTPYTYNWNTTTSTNGAHALTATARDAAGNQKVATVNITIAAPPNQPPTILIVSPANNAGFLAPATVNFTVNASDDGGIAKVDFYANQNLIGTSATPPFGFSWGNVVPGTYLVTAKATDNLGLETLSAGVNLSVCSCSNP